MPNCWKFCTKNNPESPMLHSATRNSYVQLRCQIRFMSTKLLKNFCHFLPSSLLPQKTIQARSTQTESGRSCGRSNMESAMKTAHSKHNLCDNAGQNTTRIAEENNWAMYVTCASDFLNSFLLPHKKTLAWRAPRERSQAPVAAAKSNPQ